MKYISVCSGIEAATVAWHSLGWRPLSFSEIEPFPSAVLAHHYPEVPNVGDMTNYKEWNFGESTDLLVGGTPCQSFSVAGLRKGLEDPRGNLALVYLGIADHFRPRWILWENVPGVLSSNRGRDFGAFLGALAELGYGFAYRVLDAQWFGVAQRRRRVFVVGYLGDWRPAATVLFERESLRRDTAPRREAGEGFARTSGTLTANGGGLNRPAGNANELDFCIPTTGTLSSRSTGGGGLGTDFECAGGLQPVAKFWNGKDYAEALTCTSDDQRMPDKGRMQVVMQPVIAPSLTASNDPSRSPQSSEVTQQVAAVHAASMAVRRLTPIECERLQGFPDNYTNIPWRKSAESPDGPRYKALGNSMAVPVMRWIGQRIAQVDELLS